MNFNNNLGEKMKKIIFLTCCILNMVAMKSPKSNFTDEEIQLRLRFSPFERAVFAIINNDQESLSSLVQSNPRLLEVKSPSFANAKLVDVAKAYKKFGIARYLILNENQDERKNSEGVRLSPLHIAAEYGDAELAKFLVNNGECPETIDENGIRPISVARKRDNKAVFKTYQKHIDGYVGDDESVEDKS
jgi:hypothetical protein